MLVSEETRTRTRLTNVMSVIKSGETMTQNKTPRYNVYVQDMFLDTKQPKKHQERFIRKLLGDDAYYARVAKKERGEKCQIISS